MEPLPDECGRKWRSHQIADVLSNNGYKTELFTSSYSHFYGYQRSNRNFISNNYSIKLCFATSYSRRSKLRRIISQLIFSLSLFLRISFSRPKIIIASYPHSFSIIALAILKPFIKYKLIVDIRDSLKQPSGKLISNIYNFFEKILSYFWFKYTNLLIGPGEEVYKYLPRGLHLKSKKIYRNVPMTYCNQSKIQTSNSINKFDFIFIGSLSQAFELENFFNFFKTKNKNLNLWILGDGPLLKKYKKKYSNIKNIKFLGQVNYKTIKSIADKSKFGLMPYSAKEKRFAYHLTNKLGEYLSFGILPLVPEHCYEMANFVRRNSCGITYDSKNINSFLHNIIINYKKDQNQHLKSTYRKYLSFERLNNVINKVIDELNTDY
tara:strand:+ start:747 stop:1880 length:1134 start_codon:yes stop_codon:yes gene_type:complete